MPRRSAFKLSARGVYEPRQTESQFMAGVLEYAGLRGWTWFHDAATNTARRCSACGAVRRTPRNAAGWPDLVLLRERTVYAELKADDGVLSAEQEAWLERLRRAGNEVYVWRPSDRDEWLGVLL